MSSRLLVLPQSVRQLRQFTFSAFQHSRGGFRAGGIGLVSLFQSFNEAFRQTVPKVRERIRVQPNVKSFPPPPDRPKDTDEQGSWHGLIETSNEHDKTNLSDAEKMLNCKYGHMERGMSADEFAFFSEINEEKLKEIGIYYEIEHLSPGEFPSSPFPVGGQIWGINKRLMVPLVCQWTGRPNKPMTNVWFLVHTGAPSSYLTPLTIKTLVDDTKIHTPPGIDILIQGKKKVVQCHISHGDFKEVNILGMDVMRKMELQLHFNWDTMTFKLYNSSEDGKEEAKT